MKILHLADLHLNHDWFDWVISASRDFDAVVLAGDLQNAFSNTVMHDQARAIHRWLMMLVVPTIVCSGNHDYWVAAPKATDTFAEARSVKQMQGQGNVIAVDGASFTFGGLRWGVKGWLQELPPARSTSWAPMRHLRAALPQVPMAKITGSPTCGIRFKPTLPNCSSAATFTVRTSSLVAGPRSIRGAQSLFPVLVAMPHQTIGR